MYRAQSRFRDTSGGAGPFYRVLLWCLGSACRLRDKAVDPGYQTDGDTKHSRRDLCSGGRIGGAVGIQARPTAGGAVIGGEGMVTVREGERLRGEYDIETCEAGTEILCHPNVGVTGDAKQQPTSFRP